MPKKMDESLCTQLALLNGILMHLNSGMQDASASIEAHLLTVQQMQQEIVEQVGNFAALNDNETAEATDSTRTSENSSQFRNIHEQLIRKELELKSSKERKDKIEQDLAQLKLANPNVGTSSESAQMKRLRLMNWKLTQLLVDRTEMENNKSRVLSHSKRVLEAEWKVQSSHQRSAISRIEQQVKTVITAIGAIDDQLAKASETDKPLLEAVKEDRSTELQTLRELLQSLSEKHQLFLDKKNEYFEQYLLNRQKKWNAVYNKNEREIEALKEVVSKTLKEVSAEEDDTSQEATGIKSKENQLRELATNCRIQQQQLQDLQGQLKEKEVETERLKGVMALQMQAQNDRNKKLVDEIKLRKAEFADKEQFWEQEKRSFENLINDLHITKSQQQVLLQERCNSVVDINVKLRALQDRLTDGAEDARDTPTLTTPTTASGNGTPQTPHTSPTIFTPVHGDAHSLPIVHNLTKTFETVLIGADDSVSNEVKQVVFTVDWMVQENDKLQKKLKLNRQKHKGRTSTLEQEKKKLADQIRELQDQLLSKEKELQAKSP